MHLDAHGRTDTGKVRETNEDHFVIATLRKAVTVELTSLPATEVFERRADSRARVLVVADGVGGVAGGELASGMAVETIVAFLGQMSSGFQQGDVEQENDFVEMMEGAVRSAHELIQATYGAHGRSPATTLTMVVIAWPRAYFVHVGDSRAYYLRRGRLRQLTRDQTTGDYAVDLGIMSEEKARKAGLYNRLSSAVGGELNTSAGLVDLEEGDVLLMCTDGLTKHVSDDQIAATLSVSVPAETTTASLLQQTLDAGATDNVTVIVVRAVAE